MSIAFSGKPDVQISIPSPLGGDFKRAPLYTVSREILASILCEEPPASMSEPDLKKALFQKLEMHMKLGGWPGEFAHHLAGCREKLRSPSDTEAREAIGESLAAIAIYRRFPGCIMIRGYGGHGHRGIDQIWVSKDGLEYVIVEAKGGQGTLSDKPVYDQSGISQRGEIGFQVDTSQMSTAWVFIGCNKIILNDKFTAAMLNATPFNAYAPAHAVHALRICMSLWDPLPSVVGPSGQYKHDSVSLSVAPTGCLNRVLELTPGEGFFLPKITGVVCVNEVIIQTTVLAVKRAVKAAPTVDSHPPGGRSAFDFGEESEADGKMAPAMRQLGPVAMLEKMKLEQQKRDGGGKSS